MSGWASVDQKALLTTHPDVSLLVSPFPVSPMRALLGPRRPTPLARRPRVRHAAVAATPDAPTAVTLTFGAPLLDAALAAAAQVGADIVVGCCSGSCGVCEVEVSRPPDGDPATFRSCVSAVPYHDVVVSLPADDAVWGVDAWDT